MAPESGFTVAEVMVAVAVGAIVTFAVGSAQSMVTNEMKANQQKSVALGLGRELARAMAQEPSDPAAGPGQKSTCTCNVEGLVVTDAPGGLYQAEFPAGRALNTACTNGVAFAAKDMPVPDGWGLKIARVSVADLTPIDGVAPDAKQYVGSIKIEFQAEGATRAIRPLVSPRAFRVDAGAIVECGPALRNILYKISDDPPVSNDPVGMTPSVAQCPADTKVLGGGWLMMPITGALPPGCTDPMFAEVLSSYVSTSTPNAWTALVRCHPIKAVAVCWKPTDVGAAAFN